MEKSSLILLVVALMAMMGVGPSAAQDSSSAPQPTRINRAIELLEQGQPVYYTTAVGEYTPVFRPFRNFRQEDL